MANSKKLPVWKLQNVEVLFKDLTEPYQFDKNSSPSYNLTVKIDPENNKAHKAFKEKIDEMCQDLFEKASADKKDRLKKSPIKEDTKDGVGTGKFLVKLHSKYKPRIYDAKRQDITANPPEVTMGSVVNISFYPKTFITPIYYGVTLYLRQVQIVELREIDEIPADPDFGEIEGGYVADTEEGSDFEDAEKFF